MRVKVFFTVDVEIWCNGWDDLDRNFPDAFRRYVYGPTKRGEYGLTRTLQQLHEHGLSGVFFTEPLFSTRFGKGALEEIVGLIRESGQEVQLHLHTEWADEVSPPLVAGLNAKRQHLWMFGREQQRQLIATGMTLLQDAGAGDVNAFRAGSFGMNRDTYRALSDLGISYDASFNALMTPLSEGLGEFEANHQPYRVDRVWEYPMTLFVDATGRTRHAQLGACSFRELAWLLMHAAEQEWHSVVILSHNFELMNRAKTRRDPIADHRFARLCRFLSRNADVFDTTGFATLTPPDGQVGNAPPPRCSAVTTLGRLAEQALRRVYQ